MKKRNQLFVSILYSRPPEKSCPKVTKIVFFVPVDEKSVANGTAGCIILGEQGKGRDGMGNVLIYNLERYLPPHTIPLYVEEVKPGCHPARQVHGHTFMEIVLVLADRRTAQPC